MNSYQYATSITPASEAVFNEMFSYYRAKGWTFDAAMQTAIADEQAFILEQQRAARREEQEQKNS